MSEIEIESELVTFVEQTRLGDQVWVLSAEDGGVVVCESNQFEEADVLLLWDSEAKAQAQCKDEWQQYSPFAISVDELLFCHVCTICMFCNFIYFVDDVIE